MSDQLIRISKQNIDVLGTAGTAPNNLIFDSTLNTFKIISEGTAGVSFGTAGGTTTVAHNQSSVPAAYAFFKFGSGYVSLPTQADLGTVAGGDFGAIWNVEIDSTNIYFTFGTTSGTDYNGTVKYYIFEAPAL